MSACRNQFRFPPLPFNMKLRLLPVFVAGAALLAWPLTSFAAATKGDAPAHISQGQTITLADHLVAGKITVVDFTSQYCPPCRRISPLLDKLHASRADIAVVKVDINRPETKGIDWKSPVAQQFGLRSIPHFKVFDKDGKLMAEGDEAYEMVNRWLQ